MNDPAKWQAWRKLWLRILRRWVLLSLGIVVPSLLLAILAFRFHVIPEGVAVGGSWSAGLICVPLMFVVRRRSLRDLEEFEQRELTPEH